ncbi:MAG: arylsulfatase [Planctomycetaceae bacterium]|nr:arylsulfatase [Planctomycetaceae bacterium]
MKLVSTVLVVFLSLLTQATSAEKRPNVIVVMTDDQGYGEFSCHGNPLIQTPHIDRFAAESLRLTDFHVSPMCTPTRGQLMTGVDAFRNAAINVSSGRTLLRPEIPTMADTFRAAGYRTGMFGKWHLGDNYPFRPEDRGFEEALWFPSSHINSVPDFWNNDYFNDTYIRNGQRRKYDGYCTDLFFDEAIEWIRKGGDQPFFAYIPLNAAHWPWFVPDKYREPIRQAMRDNPDVVKHLKPGKKDSLVSFLAMGANIDDNMGKLNEALNTSGLMDETIVVFLTDNGSTMGPDYFNAGMRGKKTTLWEGGHRVPCFIRWPGGNLGSPRDIRELAHVQDLLPTLADLAEVPLLRKELDGVSLGSLFRGERETLDDRMLVINYSRMPTFRVTYTKGNPAIPQMNGAAVMWKGWRFLENRMLFNIADDPHQDTNVADQHPEVVAQMRQHLEQWWDGVRDDVFEPQRVIIGDDRENPMMLTACEWLDVFVDQQRQIRRGDLKNGVWHLNVAQSGTYTFELRRWPRESKTKLAAPVPAIKVTDGEYPAGKALPIARGKLKIGDRELSAEPEANGQSIRFTANLTQGDTTLQTWFLDENGREVCGAYYVYVKRLE